MLKQSIKQSAVSQVQQNLNTSKATGSWWQQMLNFADTGMENFTQ